MPAPQALMTLALPTIVSQLINLIYNVGDTFFVGKTGDPYKIAGVSLGFVIFFFTIVFANMYGIGGGGLIARLLGVKEYDRARKISMFAVYAALLTSAVYSLAVAVFMTPLLTLLGASEKTIGYAKEYLTWAVVFGGIPIIMSNVFAQLVRNVGYSKQAGFGLSAGGILNLFLDPLFMFVIFPEGKEVFGAAFATFLSNLIILIYFIRLFKKISKETSLSLDPRIGMPESRDIREMYSVGIPSGIMVGLFDVANIFMNRHMAAHGDLQLAAMGIILKAERLPYAIGLGISQGGMPLIAYNYSSGNHKRMREVIRIGRIIGITVSVLSVVLYILFAGGIFRFFLSTGGSANAESLQTIEYGVRFMRLRCIASPFSFMCYHTNYLLQGMGDGKDTLILAVLRSLVFYVSLIFIMDAAFGMDGLAAAFPISEFVATINAFVVSERVMRKAEKRTAG